MIRPVVLLDIDGVVANFVEGCLPIIRMITGRTYQHDDVTQWQIEKALGLDTEETAELYRNICQEGWCAHLRPYEGAKEGVAALRAFADVVPVTSHFFTSKHWVSERDEWIVEHLGIPKTDIVHTHAKYRVLGDVLVDDKTSHLDKWSAHHAMGHGVLFLRNYNKNDGWLGSSAADWPSLVSTIEVLTR